MRTREQLLAAADEIAAGATAAFWAYVALHAPEAQHGDLAPDADDAWQRACVQAVRTWLESNAPADDDEPAPEVHVTVTLTVSARYE